MVILMHVSYIGANELGTRVITGAYFRKTFGINRSRNIGSFNLQSKLQSGNT